MEKEVLFYLFIIYYLYKFNKGAIYLKATNEEKTQVFILLLLLFIIIIIY
jgi:hypothetical protein